VPDGTTPHDTALGRDLVVAGRYSITERPFLSFGLRSNGSEYIFESTRTAACLPLGSAGATGASGKWGRLAGRPRRLIPGDTRVNAAARPEPAQVQMHDGRPSRFVWRGRLYTVISIVSRPGESGSVERPAGSDVAEDPAGPPGGRPAAGDVYEHDHLPSDWRCWRVTAAPGRNVPAVGFRLCHDPPADRWLLSRE
jgi:hypothetical protein